MRHLLKLLSLVPLPALYPVGWVIYVIVFHILRWRRDQGANDIALAFPDRNPTERARILRQSYRNLADVVMEALWGFSASAEALARRDYTVVMATLTIGAVLVMLGILVSDLLYVVADPRIKFEKAER